MQLEKHNAHNTSTDAGIWIVSNRINPNGDSSICVGFEVDPNATNANDLRNDAVVRQLDAVNW
jgi:hypothetical protein